MVYEALQPMTALVDWMTVLTGFIALGLFLVSIPLVARILTRQQLATTKYRTVGRVLRTVPRSFAKPVSWLKMRSAINARAKARFAGMRATPADEIDWLSKVLRLDFAVSFVDDSSRSWLAELAKAYEKLAARLSVNGLLGAGQPILEAEADLARRVFEVLHVHAQRASSRDLLTARPLHTITMPNARKISYFGIAPGIASVPHSLLVSWRRLRLVTANSFDDRALDSEGTEYVELPHAPGAEAIREALITTDHAYDGILPAMHAARIEKDARTGHARLHLSITESSYSAHLGVRDLGTSAPQTTPRIITLSLLPITSDDRIVLVRRSTHNHSYAGDWAPGINGNLDIPDQRRKNTDADEAGRPDPIRAIIREGREELGLDIPRAAVAVHGLSQIHTVSDNGSWVLAQSAQLRMSFADVADGTRFADPVEGRWELGGELCGIPVPTSASEAHRILTWAHSEPDVIPHVGITLAFYFDSLGLLAGSNWAWTSSRSQPLPQGSIVRPVTMR